MCNTPIIYPSLPEYIPLLSIYATLPEYTPPSLNIPPPLNRAICDPPRIYTSQNRYRPFLTTICDTPIIYLFLPEYTPLFFTIICDAPRICPALQESTLPSQNIGLPRPLRYATLPEYAHLSRIYPLLRHYMHTPRIYPGFLSEYTPILNIYRPMRPS